MKKVQMGFMALAALVGVTSAFTTKSKAKSDDSLRYGILGETTGHSRYIVEEFNSFTKKCDEAQSSSTCSFTFTSANVLTQVTKTAVVITVAQAAYTNK